MHAHLLTFNGGGRGFLFLVFIEYDSQHINLFRTKLRRNDVQGCMRIELMHVKCLAK